MRVKTAADIGALIRDRRTDLSWSQEELASRIGVSRLWIVQLEQGKATAQLGLVLRALKTLEIELDASPLVKPAKRTGPLGIDLDELIRPTDA